jgi:bacterioferritin-associated ferredoxin
MSHELDHCACHKIEKAEFEAALQQGAHSVKTCFKAMGCLPKCNNCIPMVRGLIAKHSCEQQQKPR